MAPTRVSPSPARNLLLPASLLLVGATFATGTPPGRDLDLSVDVDRLEPAVEIKQYENRTVEEYAVNGNVYMIKVTPKYGRPYYISDPEGDGDMEWRRNSAGLDVKPPQWALFTW
jgi:hypothetical protein